ncbi:MOSC domain-containing protein [Cellulophaga baltica]|uniref:MOSC domain-containing protein n=1 Tax=Cellulophaga TaxID=104264 RepID=UPI001C0678F4|nr:MULTISPECIES: MOSC domain-containing protein [Cellulophaga]MBU2998063.1 MOSC domain-containing protein [Cellulophaga baltica]MDO6769465.1 MOSC domain-containing protein [Cellulophaga sp. 1_MG-2023]
MKVISTNIGTSTTIKWNGKEEQTGIYKYPTNKPLFLNTEDVDNDTVIDRRYHGGVNKACYLYAAEQYDYWKNLYPNLDWNWGMFGENLTIKGLDESTLRIGDVYELGSALVQITQPREPCYKLGVRFQDQKIIKQFVQHNYPGTYIKILETGTVTIGDTMLLKTQSTNALTIHQYYEFLFAKEKDQRTIRLILENDALPNYKKERVKNLLK